MKINRDAFYLIEVTWRGGFKHKVPVRGYNFASQMRFNNALEYVDSAVPEEVTEEVYNTYVYGDYYASEGNREAETQQENPPKRSRSKTKGKDSKSVRNPSGKSTRVTKTQPSVVRKPKLRDVSKPKKDNGRKDSAGTKKPAGTGRTKRSSQ